MRTDDEVRAQLVWLRRAIADNWRPFEVWFVMYQASQSRSVPGLLWGCVEDLINRPIGQTTSRR